MCLQTGTLTENRMTVVEGWFAGKHYGDKVPDMKDLPEAVREHIELNIAMNSKVGCANPLLCSALRQARLHLVQAAVSACG